MSDGTSVDELRERAARNQSLFREVNERIVTLGAPASFVAFVCECLDLSCDKNIPLTIQEYEHIRADPNLFLVWPGHEVSKVEETIERNDRYFLVKKLGVGAEVAGELDPREP